MAIIYNFKILCFTCFLQSMGEVLTRGIALVVPWDCLSLPCPPDAQLPPQAPTTPTGRPRANEGVAGPKPSSPLETSPRLLFLLGLPAGPSELAVHL